MANGYSPYQEVVAATTAGIVSNLGKSEGEKAMEKLVPEFGAIELIDKVQALIERQEDSIDRRKKRYEDEGGDLKSKDGQEWLKQVNKPLDALQSYLTRLMSLKA